MAASLEDVLTRHQVLVQRLAANEVGKFDAFLREMDTELRKRLSGDELTDFSRARLEKLLSAVDEMLAGIFSDHSKVVLADLQDFAQHEAGFSARALQTAVDLEVVVPSATQITAAVLTTPLSVRGPDSGNLLKSFIADWNANDRKAVTGAIRRGVFEGQPNAQIVKAIRGTKALNYTDGLLNVTARHAAAVVHTAVQNVSTAARMRTFNENADIVQGVQWVSTLDNRTCPVCGALDGRRFALDKGPRSPLHVRCRCTCIPWLKDEFAQLMPPRTTRASAGADGGKQVSAGLTFYQWLLLQPPAFQDMALGVTRAKLLREGGLSASRFAALQLDKRFLPMTLAQMKLLEPLAFLAAGITP